MSDGTSESWSGVEPASPAPRRPRFVKGVPVVRRVVDRDPRLRRRHDRRGVQRRLEVPGVRRHRRQRLRPGSRRPIPSSVGRGAIAGAGRLRRSAKRTTSRRGRDARRGPRVPRRVARRVRTAARASSARVPDRRRRGARRCDSLGSTGACSGGPSRVLSWGRAVTEAGAASRPSPPSSESFASCALGRARALPLPRARLRPRRPSRA